MQPAPPSVEPHPAVTDAARLASLEGSGLLTEAHEPTLDRWTRLAAGLIGAPISLLSLVDGDRQYFKSHVGLPEDVAAARETPLSHSFCQHVVSSERPLIVADARQDPLLHDNAAVEDLGVIAYAGRPVTTRDGHVLGSFCVIDHEPHEWSTQELGLLEDLAAGLVAELDLRAALGDAERLKTDLHRQARRDALTGLANRRQLADDLEAAIGGQNGPTYFAIFDLDGFKAYNDTFGHPAGDALLVRLASRLGDALSDRGTAYRLGGDEFCVLALDEAAVLDAAASLSDRGAGFAITNSYGQTHLEREVVSVAQAMQLADERLYDHKRSRSDQAQRQAHDVLLGVLRECQPALNEHVHEVASLARAVGATMRLSERSLDELEQAAQMHDIGKVAIPDSILNKPSGLDEDEWALMRRHTLLGERILRSAPALAGIATIVRSSHERWDGAGYPDGLSRSDIPLAARIVFACDAFHAITSDRSYRPRRTATEAMVALRREAGRQLDPHVVEVLDAYVAGLARG